MYTDHTITCEVAVLENNFPQIDAHPEWFGGGSYQKKKIEETSRQSCVADATPALEFVIAEIKHLEFDTVPEWFVWPVKKGTLGNSRQHSMMGAALTRELVVIVNFLHFPSDSGIAPVKKWLIKSRGEVYTICRIRTSGPCLLNPFLDST